MPEINQNIFLNRYPGVKPFSVKEDFLFFGRETDIQELNTLIFIKQTIVLYGKSGYGKSSLINAGIIPKLKENDVWVYFSVRFNNYSEKETEHNLSPSQTVKQRFAENLVVENDNILDALIPNEDSFWYWIKQNQLQKSKVHFIIFFDQFEELFTYPKEQVNEFSEQLSQLLYNTLPLNFKKKIAEVKTINPISNELHDFLYEKPEVKVIFSIRSDRLSLLNTLTDKHPSILQNCYELDALNIDDARKAIIAPAKLPKELGFETPEFSFTDAAVEKILSSIVNPQDGKIEAATLQIVCRYIEDSLIKERNYSIISDTELGNITDIFQQYYEGTLNKLSEREKNQAQHLIEDELIDDNRRNTLSATYIKSRFGLSDNLLILLEQSSLLKKERDAAGRILYEVSHDSLIEAINKVAQDRRKNEDAEKNKQLEEKYELERKKADELLMLNRKAKNRSRVAIILAIACIFFAFFSRSSLIDAKKEKKNAEAEKENAKKAEQIAVQALVDVKKKDSVIEFERQNTEKARQNAILKDYDKRMLSYEMNLNKAEEKLNNAETFIKRNPDLAKDAVNEAKRLMQTQDTLPNNLLRKKNILVERITKLGIK